MVNPRWRPKIANSRIPDGKHNKENRKALFSIPETEDTENEFRIDLTFLLHGMDFTLLNNLSPYERYIIFLKFKEDKSILQMSHILQKDRRVVKNHFDSIIIKIKENLKKKITLTEVKNLIKIRTRQYTKRQFTWARGKMSSWMTINTKDYKDILDTLVN